MNYETLPLAPDIEAIVLAFREAGGLSFDTFDDHLEVRALYEANCKAAAYEMSDSIHVVDRLLTLGSQPITIRQYSPIKGRPDSNTCTIFMHGGGWVIGSLDSHDNLCRYFCQQSGSDVIAIDYGLAPEQSFDEIINQCLQAVTFLVENYKQYDINPKRLALMGDSAGGYLAHYVAHQFCLQADRSLLAQILLYPVVSLNPTMPSYKEFEAGFMLNANTMRWFLAHCQLDTLQQAVANYDLTALAYSEKNGAVFLNTVGYDPLRDEGLLLAQHLAARGAYLEHVHLPRHVHGVFTMLGKVPTARLVLDKAAYFLQNLRG